MRALRGLLWVLAMLAWVAGAGVWALKPYALGRDALLAAALVSLVAIVSLMTIGGTAEHAERLKAATGRLPLDLREMLWLGLAAGLVMLAVGDADPHHLKTVLNLGILSTFGCPAALTLRWGFARSAKRAARREEERAVWIRHADPVRAAMAENSRRIEANETLLHALSDGLSRTFQAAGRPVPAALEEDPPTQPVLRVIGLSS